MCGRYTLTAPGDVLRETFGLDAAPELAPRYNVAPTQEVALVRRNESGAEAGARELALVRWGLVPFWAKERSIGAKLINARAESLAEKPAYRDSFRKRRCLIPVTEFAEAEGEKGAKTWTWFSLPNEEVFAVAGIWRDTDEWGPAYSMVMTEACIHVQGVHDRMPVILARDTWADWLDGPPDAAKLLCQPYPADMVVRRTTDSWVVR